MKKKQRRILAISAMLLCTVLCVKTQAQQSRIDSAITLLNKSNTPKGLDTLTFNIARQLIISAVLTDTHISQIEKTAKQFINSTDEDVCYVVKYSIFQSLSVSDKYKAIDYGRKNLEELEKSITPLHKNLRTAFLGQLRLPYRNSSKLPEGLKFFTERLAKYKKDNDSLGIARCYYILGGFYRTIGLYEPAIYNMKKSISFIDSSYIDPPDHFGNLFFTGKYFWINNTAVISDYYIELRNYPEAIKFCTQAVQEAVIYYRGGGGDKETAEYLLFNASNISLSKILSNQLDSVEYFLTIAENTDVNNPHPQARAYLKQILALYNIQIGSYDKADLLLKECWELVNTYRMGVNLGVGIMEPDYYLALLRIKQNRSNEAIALLLKNIERVKTVRSNVLRDYKLLAELYEKTGDNEKAKQAFKSFISLQDSLLADQSKYRTISFETEQQINENEIAITKLESATKVSAQARNFTIGIATLLLILAGSIYYRFRSKKKANEVLEKTLTDLKSTQSQLIQSEKMASLGELTAGIAHEIQNPLNFVNNFSEVSGELIEELKSEKLKAERDEQLEDELLTDISANLEKINHHGKRAADIVKGMLQHSRSSSGTKEPTDMNALADEYLRLAYHGLRAKDKSFNATMKTNFDESIGNINIVPQDIGRVILNLITNAFYVVNEKTLSAVVTPTAVKYEPTVSVSTKKEGEKVFISVADNGNGIPQKILDKIFQPFFTTKPTGQGTGLGLSLSYDIVKAHGGELKVSTKEGEGTTFIISIPV